jgi:hypothetical protein
MAWLSFLSGKPPAPFPRAPRRTTFTEFMKRKARTEEQAKPYQEYGMDIFL